MTYSGLKKRPADCNGLRTRLVHSSELKASPVHCGGQKKTQAGCSGLQTRLVHCGGLRTRPVDWSGFRKRGVNLKEDQQIQQKRSG